MRCPDCNKMVSYDTEVEPEEQDELSVDTDGNLDGSYRRVLNCAECGCELKEYIFTLEGPLDESVEQKCSKEEHSFEVKDVVVEATESAALGKRGKPLKGGSPLYGIEVKANVSCEHCDFKAEIEYSSSVSAAEFDELV